ncbi:hypothetical protein F2Q69_00017771 [Brassica cretica]|uniref:Uncharacterized protein n=1 Tax=Brassica cretica TaxID=69181 RepID=A0A8S9QMX0_BRACR|nr:hypothetical protein F2Q69_00017771 [Brassica cretica]
MDEKRETSSGPPSQPPSIPGLSGEKRGNEDGSEEKDESDVLAKDVKPKKASSVSKYDDRLVTNALPETRTVKDVTNCETRGGVHVDEVTESVVVIPRDASVSHHFHTSSALERQESMRQWMEMKRNGYLSGPLGGPVASRPRKRAAKWIADGVETGGIIRDVRSKEDFYSSLKALIRNAEGGREDRALPSTTEQAKSLAVEAATVASQWLEFLHQDLSERLSAVKDSRKRVDDTLEAELPLVVSSSKESSSANQESTTSGGVSLDKEVTEAHRMKWSAKFDEFKKRLHDEEKDLESSLNQVKDMQSRCNEGLRQFGERYGTSQETNLAVQAAAASIFSTCRYLLSKMKPPT